MPVGAEDLTQVLLLRLEHSAVSSQSRSPNRHPSTVAFYCPLTCFAFIYWLLFCNKL